jgi:hypothetical protein
MNISIHHWFLGVGLIAGSALLVGCEEDLTQEDVNQHRRDAQVALDEAREEARDAQAEVDRQVALVERERREALADLQARLHEPDADAAEIREDMLDVNREADRKIAEIRRDAAGDLSGVHEDAQEKLNEARIAEQRYESQQARDRYVQDTEQALAKMDTEIARLRDHTEVREPEGFDRMMDIVDQRRDQAASALDSLKSAKAEEWKTFQDEVETALRHLKSAYTDAAQSLDRDRLR